MQMEEARAHLALILAPLLLLVSAPPPLHGVPATPHCQFAVLTMVVFVNFYGLWVAIILQREGSLGVIKLLVGNRSHWSSGVRTDRPDGADVANPGRRRGVGIGHLVFCLLWVAAPGVMQLVAGAQPC